MQYKAFNGLLKHNSVYMHMYVYMCVYLSGNNFV